MLILFIAFNIKQDFNENSFFVRVNKVSISEATVRVSLCLLHRISSIVYHLGLFKYSQSGSLISVRKITFFCYYLRLRLVVLFIYFTQLFFIKKTSLCAFIEEIFRVTNKGKKSCQIHYRREYEGPEGIEV